MPPGFTALLPLGVLFMLIVPPACAGEAEVVRDVLGYLDRFELSEITGTEITEQADSAVECRFSLMRIADGRGWRELSFSRSGGAGAADPGSNPTSQPARKFAHIELVVPGDGMLYTFQENLHHEGKVGRSMVFVADEPARGHKLFAFDGSAPAGWSQTDSRPLAEIIRASKSVHVADAGDAPAVAVVTCESEDGTHLIEFDRAAKFVRRVHVQKRPGDLYYHDGRIGQPLGRRKSADGQPVSCTQFEWDMRVVEVQSAGGVTVPRTFVVTSNADLSDGSTSKLKATITWEKVVFGDAVPVRERLRPDFPDGTPAAEVGNSATAGIPKEWRAGKIVTRVDYKRFEDIKETIRGNRP